MMRKITGVRRFAVCCLFCDDVCDHRFVPAQSMSEASSPYLTLTLAIAENQAEPELKPTKKWQWSDEEEEEDEVSISEEEKIAALRMEREEILKKTAELEKRLSEIDDRIPHEQPKESSKGKLVCTSFPLRCKGDSLTGPWLDGCFVRFS